MITKQTVLEVVKNKGPLIPIDIMRELGGNTFFIGAVLSELSSAGQVKISSVKVGGSPVYYTEDQLEKLENFKNYLNEKDLRAYELLNEKKVLRDSEQNPLIQVCLKSIKDFAKPLKVKFSDSEEIFWKWYTLTDAEAIEVIREIVNGKKEKVEEIKKEEPKTEIKPEPVETKTEVKEEKPVEKVKEEPKKEEVQKSVEEYKAPKLDDDFGKFVIDYLENNNISIVKQAVDKKGKELSFELLVPSHVGRIKFYAKAFSKAKLSDGDLSKVFMQSTLDKLPALVLYTGDLTKKANEVVSRFTNFILKKME